MNRITSVVATTDFSLPALHAVHRAALVAAGHGATLHLVHAHRATACRPLQHWSGSTRRTAQSHDAARRLLDNLALAVADTWGVRVQPSMRRGDASEVALAAAADADLLVVAGRSASALDDFVRGGPGQRLMGRVTQPLLIVRRPPAGPWRRVLAAVDDFGDDTRRELHDAARLAPDAALHLFHACTPLHDSALRRAGIAEREIERRRLVAEASALIDLRSLAASLLERLPGVPEVSAAVGHGSAAALLLEQARREDADLLVGLAPPGGWLARLCGDTTTAVLQGCDTDVLLLPEPRTAPRPAARPTLVATP